MGSCTEVEIRTVWKHKCMRCYNMICMICLYERSDEISEVFRMAQCWYTGKLTWNCNSKRVWLPMIAARALDVCVQPHCWDVLKQENCVFLLKKKLLVIFTEKQTLHIQRACFVCCTTTQLRKGAGLWCSCAFKCRASVLRWAMLGSVLHLSARVATNSAIFSPSWRNLWTE